MRVVVIQLMIAVFVSVAFATLMGAVRPSEPVRPDNVKLRQVEGTAAPERAIVLSSVKAEISRSLQISAPVDYD